MMMDSGSVIDATTGKLLYLPVIECKFCEVERVMKRIQHPALSIELGFWLMECQVCKLTQVIEAMR
jgi:hypothetical protein